MEINWQVGDTNCYENFHYPKREFYHIIGNRAGQTLASLVMTATKQPLIVLVGEYLRNFPTRGFSLSIASAEIGRTGGDTRKGICDGLLLL